MARWLVLVGLLALAGCPDAADTTDTSTDSGVDTWSNYAQGFFADYCVACHSSGDKDFRQYADVSAWSDVIRCGVASTMQTDCNSSPGPKQFPIGTGPKPTDAERDRIVAWIDAGLPE